MSIERRLKQLEETPINTLKRFFTPVGLARRPDRPLYMASNFDLERLVELLRAEAIDWVEIGARVSCCALDGVLHEPPIPAELLDAVRAELNERRDEHPKGRGFTLEGRPRPQGGRGLGSCGLYHAALDEEINPEAPAVVFGEVCTVCGAEPFTYQPTN